MSPPEQLNEYIIEMKDVDEVTEDDDDVLIISTWSAKMPTGL